MGICIIRGNLYLFTGCIHIPALCAFKHKPDRRTGPGGKRWNDESMTYTHVQVEPNRPHRSIWFASPWFRERLGVPTFFFFLPTITNTPDISFHYTVGKHSFTFVFAKVNFLHLEPFSPFATLWRKAQMPTACIHACCMKRRAWHPLVDG